jgi:superfamily II DNA or RNA helicase
MATRTTTSTASTPVHPIALVRQRIMRAGVERWLLNPIADVTPQLFRFSRRGARLAERLAGDRPLLTLSSALAEVSGQAAGLGKPGAGIPRVLVDKLAYALHRLIDESSTSATPWDFTFPDGTAPEPLPAELQPLLSAAQDLLLRLQHHQGFEADAVSSIRRRRTRVAIEDGPPAGFFYSEDPGPVPPGMLLAVDDVDSKPLHFVGVRGPVLSTSSQWYAVDRIIDVIKEPLFEEGPRLRRLAGGRFGALLAALDELVVVDEDRPRLAWVINPATWQAFPVVRGAASGLDLKAGVRSSPQSIEAAVRAVPFATDADRAFVTALVARHRCDGIVAAALVGHPFVEHPDGRPLRVVTARLRVDVADDGRVSLSAMSHPVDARELGDDGATLVFDAAGQRVLVVGADAQERALAKAVVHVGDAPLPAEVLTRVSSRLKRARVDVALPERLRGQQVATPQQLLVKVAFVPRTFSDKRVDPVGGGARFTIVSRPFVDGATHPPGEGQRLVFASDQVGGSRWCERDLDAERKLATSLMELVGVLDDDEARLGGFSFALRRPDTALAALAALYAHNNVVVAVADDGPRVQRASAEALRVRLHDGTDWLGIEGGLHLDEARRVSLQALIDALRDGRRYVVLERGDIVTFDDELITALSSLSMFSRTSDHGIEVPGAAAAVVIDQLAHLDDEHVDRRGWSVVRERVAAAAKLDGDTPAGVVATLRPYQQTGLRFLRRLAALGTGGVLADDMGLGKTLTTTCLLVDRAPQGPQLVVAPTSLGLHWAAELARFAPGLRPVVLSSFDGAAARLAAAKGAGPGDIVITSYGLVTRDITALSALSFTTLVLDEAQAAKNATTARAKALRRLRSAFSIALTGTPIENHTGEVWAIIDVVAPGLFGTFAQFKSRFADPIEKDHDLERRRRLARALQPFILRRKKSDVATDLPPRTERTLVLTPSPEERDTYERLRQAIIVDLEARGVLELGKKKRKSDEKPPLLPNEHRVQILAALTRLRLCACHPALVDDVADFSAVPPATKHEALVAEMLELQAQGHHALVFSQFVRHLRLAQRFLVEAGLRTLILTGETPTAERQKLVERFQAGEADVFLISLKAGGFGLNLTRASYVAHLDPWWNPAVENQASDRAHRIGQTLPVTVTRLVMDQTIEAPILALHERKRALAEGLLEGADVAGHLDLDDLVALIGSSRRHVNDDAVDINLREPGASRRRP